ncbi:MAG: hypothetical protein IJV04_05375 [Lachnospiraceae bacterium]|nr:hypothetical protein [Lachnospiraceae bacterium]
MSTVYLHIGTAKTGTTAIQRFLPLNQELLNEHGYTFPMMPFHFPRIGEGRNAHFLTTYYEEEPEIKKRWDEGFEAVKKALAQCDKVILSDENLWRVHGGEGFLEKVKSEFDKLGTTVKIVVYFRRQDHMAESHWNQMVKGKPKLSQSFFEFITKGEYADFPLDYDKGADRLAEVFGKENLIIRVYEKGQFVRGDLFSDFLEAVGLPLDEAWKNPEHAVNTRLPENVVEIKRLINGVDSYRNPEVPNFFREVIRNAYGLEMQKEIPVQKTGRFSDEARKKYMNHFEEGNTRVAGEYLNRANTRLFEEPLTDIPRWEPDGWEMMKDVVRVLAGADVYHYTNNKELKKENKAQRKRIDQLEKDLADASIRMAEQQKKLNELYNSALFRADRAIRGRKPGKDE